jgi:isoleucyl-tRNA synthetase
VPIALFVDKDTNELHPESIRLMAEVADRVEQAGIQAWFDLEPAELLQGAEAEQYRKVTDTLDVWFDSGVTHACVVDDRDYLGGPADLYLEGSDQHRGWFQSSLMTSVAMKGAAPYRQVLTHGFTVDGQGRKMSKSLGNVMSPQTVVNKLGADILRLWVASTNYSAEMTVSDEILMRSADAYRRIRNTARFLLSNLSGFDPNRDRVALDDMVALDRWVVGRAADLQQEILSAYDSYQFHVVCQKLMHFCSIELGSLYLDVIKDRQYTAKADSKARRSCQTALYLIAEGLVRWMAPIMSFTADEIWALLPGERGEFVFTQFWFDGLESLPEQAGVLGNGFWQQIIEVRDDVNKALEGARRDETIGGALQAEVTLYAAPALFNELTKLGDELRFVLLTSKANVLPLTDAPETALSCETEGLKVVVARSAGEKCERCWHHREDVGSDAAHPTICGRCVTNVVGEGELREFA